MAVSTELLYKYLKAGDFVRIGTTGEYYGKIGSVAEKTDQGVKIQLDDGEIVECPPLDCYKIESQEDNIGSD